MLGFKEQELPRLSFREVLHSASRCALRKISLLRCLKADKDSANIVFLSESQYSLSDP